MAPARLPDEVRIAIRADLDIIAVRQKAREIAGQLGFSPSDRTMLATAVSELARNIVQYATEGMVILRPFEESGGAGVTVIAEDEGPGIADLSLALQDGYSTSGSLGMGLPGVRRLMDHFEITSARGKGTRVVASMSTPIGLLRQPEPDARAKNGRPPGRSRQGDR
jgi:serine/threonine-protein kinase RsbT